MVESELRFFEVEIEGVSRHPLESGESVLGETPEGLDPIDVVAAICELVFAVPDPEMSRVSDINQAVIAKPAIAVDDGIEADLSPNNPLQRSFFGIWDDLSPDPITTLEDSENNRLPAGTATSFPLDSMRSKIRVNDHRLKPVASNVSTGSRLHSPSSIVNPSSLFACSTSP